jgi:hypothetical protein
MEFLIDNPVLKHGADFTVSILDNWYWKIPNPVFCKGFTKESNGSLLQAPAGVFFSSHTMIDHVTTIFL